MGAGASDVHTLEDIMEKESRRNDKSEQWSRREEEKVWSGFYRKVHDPAVAADLMEQLDADSEVKARHLGLYLRCRQTLRRAKVRRARARAVVEVTRSVASILVVAPVRFLRNLLMFAGAVSMAWLPTANEPAIRQMRKIRRANESSSAAGQKQGEAPEINAKQA